MHTNDRGQNQCGSGNHCEFPAFRDGPTDGPGHACGSARGCATRHACGQTQRRGGNGFGAQNCRESGQRESHAATFEQSMEFFQRAVHPHAGRIFTAATRRRERAKVLLLEKPKNDGFAILVGQLIDGIVQHGQDGIQMGVVIESIHFSGLPFTNLAPPLASHERGRHITGVSMQPTAQADVPGERRRLLRQAHEDHLGDVLRAV